MPAPTLNKDATSRRSVKQTATGTYGLKKAVLSPMETLAQSIAGIAPSATPGMLVPIVVGFAGNGSWLCYLIATVGMIFTAACINEFAKRSACPGSLYSFANQGLGTRIGFLCGWSLLFAYIFCGAGCAVEFGIYARSLLSEFFSINLPSVVALLGGSIPVAYIAYRNIKLSARMMLQLECVSILLILLLVAIALVKNGLAPDMKQLTLSGVTGENIRIGLVLSIFGFVAFESAASLGVEARDPLKTIPQALLRSVVLCGIFFVITSYAMVLCFHNSPVPLDKCATPLLTMAGALHVPALGHLIDVGIMVSFFAAALANLNGAGRTLFKMSLDGLLHKSLGASHQENQTPHVAIAFCSSLSLAIALVLTTLNYPLLDIVGWLGTLATFGFMFAYFSTSVSAAAMLRRRRELTLRKLLAIGISLGVILLAVIGSIYPIPAFPYNLLPFIFAVHMVAGVVYCYSRFRKNF